MNRFFIITIFTVFYLFLIASLSFSEDCTGTNSNPCNCCDVNAMSVTVYSPSGSYSQTYTLSYQSQSGSCSSSSYVTETWSKNIGYTFCPEEGTYTAVVTASSAGGDSSCSSYANEQSGSYNLYTVNYDSGTDADKWCACKGGTWFSTVTDGNNGNCCGDDGSNDMFENAGEGNPACVEGSVVSHDTASSDRKYAVFNGQIYYCKGPGDTGSPYSFITAINPGSEVGSCKCQSDGLWWCGTVVPIRGGRIKIVG